MAVARLNLHLAAFAPEQINPSLQVLREINAATFPSPVDSKSLKVLEIPARTRKSQPARCPFKRKNSS